MITAARAVQPRAAMHVRATMQLGAAMFRLLRRPAALAWLPLSAAASLASLAALYVLLALIDVTPRREQLAIIGLTLATLIGVLVGQSIKELQHCGFSWALPRLRLRLLPGALAIGLFVAVFAREIFAVTLWLVIAAPMALFGNVQGFGSFWGSLPGATPALMVLTFLTFWIGVRPSVVNVVGVLLPILLVSPLITTIAPEGRIAVALSTVPLTLFLIYDTFGIAEARRRPFLRTRSLSGRPWRASGARDGRLPRRSSAMRRRAHEGRIWPARPLGTSVDRWILAGWHENHGATAPFVRGLFLLFPAVAALVFFGTVIETMFESPALWFTAGYGRLSLLPGSVHLSIVSIVIGSMMVGVPLAVLCSAYGAISLRRVGLYPLSRRRQAAIEYWGSLAETFVIAGFAIAAIMGLWGTLVLVGYGTRGFLSWPPQAGSDYGWVLALMRTIAFLAIVTPLAQYYRLRHIRSPDARSPVARLVTVSMLAVVLTALGIVLALGSLDALQSYPLMLHVVIFATAAVISQYFYRRAIERYFATGDLV